MDFTNLLTAVFGVAALIGGGLAGLLYGGLRTLRDSNKDLRDRVTDLEKDRADDKAVIAGLEAQVATLQAAKDENAILRTAIRGRAEWVAVTDQLEDHHKSTLTVMQRIDDRLVQIGANLKGER